MRDCHDCDESLFEGLKSLSASAFPKTCNCCGRHYETAAAFLQQTNKIPKNSGLKAATDDDQTAIVELYRNCVCGSTLMDFFSDRRDNSQDGLEQRQKFSKTQAPSE